MKAAVRGLSEPRHAIASAALSVVLDDVMTLHLIAKSNSEALSAVLKRIHGADRSGRDVVGNHIRAW